LNQLLNGIRKHHTTGCGVEAEVEVEVKVKVKDVFYTNLIIEFK
jgi:hypothetical protein